MSPPKSNAAATMIEATPSASPASGNYEKTRKQGVAAFMKATGRDEYVDLLRKDRAAFFGPDGKPRPEMVEEVSCPSCEPGSHALGERAQPVFEKDGFCYVRCNHCRTLYVNPQLREELLIAYYVGSTAIARWNEVLLSPAQIDYDRQKFSKLLDGAISALAPATDGKPRRIVDVGASVGTFCQMARDGGHEALGVEISEDARRRAHELYGIDLYRTMDELLLGRRAIEPGSCDVISFFEVIEHLKHPAATLDLAYALLKPGGVLLALVGGNADSLAMRIMRERSLAFDMTRLAYYSPPSFSSLVGRHGLQVTATGSIIPEVDVALNYLRWDDAYKPQLDDDVFPAWFRQSMERLIEERTMGYKFWVVARKI